MVHRFITIWNKTNLIKRISIGIGFGVLLAVIFPQAQAIGLLGQIFVGGLGSGPSQLLLSHSHRVGFVLPKGFSARWNRTSPQQSSASAGGQSRQRSHHCKLYRYPVLGSHLWNCHARS